MKTLKEFVHHRINEMKDTRSPEELAADRHVYDLVMLDQDYRSKGGESFPLESNLYALTALRNYYLGTKHPQKYPEHAQKVPSYKNILVQEAPHLTGFFDGKHH